MKKVSLLLALFAFAATASFAQTTTDVKVRDNGTVKSTTVNPTTGATTVHTTGRTNTGAAIHSTKMATENTADKAGQKMDAGAHKVGHAMKHGANKTSTAMKHGAEKMEKKTE